MTVMTSERGAAGALVEFSSLGHQSLSHEATNDNGLANIVTPDHENT